MEKTSPTSTPKRREDPRAGPGFSAAELARLEQARQLLVHGHREVEAGARIMCELFWRRFVDMYRRNGQNDHDAEALANEAIYRITDKIETLRQFDHLESWAMIIARNLLNTHAKQSKRRQERELVLDPEAFRVFVDTHYQADEDAETRDCIERQIGSFEQDMPERYYVLHQSASAGWKTPELMSYLGRTDTATRRYMTECRKKFAAYVEPCLENTYFYTKKP